jgi:hypothetical protein
MGYHKKHILRIILYLKNLLSLILLCSVSAYNMIDKSFYKPEFLEANLKPILDAARKNNIKCVNIPLARIF